LHFGGFPFTEILFLFLFLKENERQLKYGPLPSLRLPVLDNLRGMDILGPFILFNSTYHLCSDGGRDEIPCVVDILPSLGEL